mmetsp:Transcript_15582/g.21536  ORF Transcript_15582/g.21536 Transcript_15582/m.21536 type:complete len:400 (-) Transcript_15582:98-1297(-)
MNSIKLFYQTFVFSFLAFDLHSDSIEAMICGGQPPEILKSLIRGVPLSFSEDKQIDTSMNEFNFDIQSYVGNNGSSVDPLVHSLGYTYRRKSNRRQLLGLRPGKDGYTSLSSGCSGKMTRLKSENNSPDPKIRISIVGEKEEALVACVRDPAACGEAAMDAAGALPSLRLLDAQTQGLPGMGTGKRYKSCALVGNGGSVRKWKFGEYIDRHEIVVRFNLAAVKGHSAYVGNRTSFRMIDHRQSVKLCCLGKYSWLLDDDDSGRGKPGVILWFPAAQPEVLSGCQRRFSGNPRYGLSAAYVDTLANAMRGLRKDLLRLGFGPFGDWYQLTTGGHAILLFTRMCESISLYGFTTYDMNKAPDQYAGRKTKAHSGEVWHDWEGEKHAWRLLHASGRVNICSL